MLLQGVALDATNVRESGRMRWILCLYIHVENGINLHRALTRWQNAHKITLLMQGRHGSIQLWLFLVITSISPSSRTGPMWVACPLLVYRHPPPCCKNWGGNTLAILVAVVMGGWLVNFLFSVFSTEHPPPRPVLDGHGSHYIYWVIQLLAHSNKVHFLCLPAQMTVILQQLDVGVKASFKGMQ